MSSAPPGSTPPTGPPSKGSGSGKNTGPHGKRGGGSPPPRRPVRGDDDEPPNRSSHTVWLVLLVLIGGIFVVFYLIDPTHQGSTVTYDFFLTQVRQGNVSEVTFHGDTITGLWKEIPDPPAGYSGELENDFNTTMPPLEDPDLLPLLKEQKVATSAANRSDGMGGGLLLWFFGPILLLMLFLFLMRRNSDPMGGGMLGSFARSPAKRFKPSDQQTTFDDVAGMVQAKKELEEIVDFLKNPEKYHRIGARIPKGVLLMGAPGNGKTLLARATAGEAEVQFFSVSGSEFIQMFVGVGASRVRDLFQKAKANAPAIMFIDEIDAVGRVRGAGVGGGHDEREQTLNQILSEMDGFTPTESVIVMAATNRPDVLDPALLRPGRFDRHITVEPPSKEGREGILKVHTRKVRLDADVDLKEIASGTIGFSGAQLANLVNEAALIASREDAEKVSNKHFAAAADRIMMGPEREEIFSEEEKEMTAYHEAGHALVGWVLPEVDPVHKVTIIPRGRAAGVTHFQPDEERHHYSETTLRSQLAMMLAGRAAEKLVFDEYAVGAQSDIQRATSIARKMVSSWGMSDEIGPVAFEQGEEHPFLGKEMSHTREFSEETARILDLEIQKILRQAEQQALDLLSEHRAKLDLLAGELLKRETIERKELIELIGERAARPRAEVNGHAQTGEPTSDAPETTDAEASVES